MVPQVLTYSTPGLGSEYALLIKDSAYAWVIAVPEVWNGQLLFQTITYNVVTPFVIAAVIYIAITFPIAQWLDRWGTKRKKKIGL